jgi:hypothetical protein
VLETARRVGHSSASRLTVSLTRATAVAPTVLSLTRTEKEFKNGGWHVTYCFEINDIIRKFESFAHTEYNIDKYKTKMIY